MRHYIAYLFFALLSQQAISQNQNICITLLDIDTGKPIPDAYVFIANSTFGSVSDISGVSRLTYPDFVRQELIISHISYNTKVLSNEIYSKYKSCDTIYMQTQKIGLGEIEIHSKRSKKWYRQLKKFSRYFIGNSKAASKCKILNPEILSFHEHENAFLAKAKGMLEIRNEHLGYSIDFLLTEFKIESDGSSRYQGKARFTDMDPHGYDQKIRDNRENAFIKSPKHFFQSIIYHQLKADDYEIAVEEFVRNEFRAIAHPSSADLIEYHPENNSFRLRFIEFLTVIDKKHRIRESEGNKPKLSIRESARFNNSNRDEIVKLHYAKSHIYKTSNFIEIDPYGNVINPGHIREYGFWAGQRAAELLPVYYGNEKVQHQISNSLKGSEPQRTEINLTEENADKAEIQDTIINGFALSNLKVDIQDIKYGGVPRDGIMSIDSPSFDSPENSRFLEDEDVLIWIETSEGCKAYPLKILNRHEIVNDDGFLISYCPLCHSAIVFDLIASGIPSEFGVSGLLFQSDVIMYDRQTHSLWSQIESRSIAGPLSGQSLKIYESHLVDFKTIKSSCPDCDILQIPTGMHYRYESDPYEAYHQSNRLMFPVNHVNPSLNNKTTVIGFKIQGKHYAIPLESIKKTSSGFKFEIQGKAYCALQSKGKIKITDAMQNEFPYQQMYWFAWFAFHPDTHILPD